MGALTWGFASTWVGGAGHRWGHGTHLSQGQRCEGDIGGHSFLQALVVVEAKRKPDNLTVCLTMFTCNNLNEGYIRAEFCMQVNTAGTILYDPM